MSGPLSPSRALAASTSSSGFADGLGRRTLAFDREEGVMLERLVVRPELAAFEKLLRERIDRVAALEDERIARPRTIERDADGGLVVVSEFVPGRRLSELLDISAERGVAPGVDVACGYLLDVLPALVGLHAGAGFAHGAIAPSRTVLTPAGQVVLLDPIYGGVLSHLRYSGRALWREFGVAVPSSFGPSRLDPPNDITQAALCALMLVLGRPIHAHEYPAAVPAMIREIAEVAQIRASAAFADALLDFFRRAVGVPGTPPYTTADDALFDVREVASELGAHVCRRALVEFIEQMENGETDTAPIDIIDALLPLDDDTDELGVPFTNDTDDHPEQDLQSGVDAEIDLDELAEDPLYDLGSVTEMELPSEESSLDDAVLLSWPQAPAAEEASLLSWPQGHEAQDGTANAIDTADEPVDDTAPAALAPRASSDPRPDSASTGPEPSVAAVIDERADQHELSPSVRERRAKRHRSSRTRKDKLRSAAAPAPVERARPAAAPVEEPAALPASPAKEPWLVPPDRAAAFEPTGPEPETHTPAMPAPPATVQAPPALPYVAPAFPPPPVARPAVPTYPALAQAPAATEPPRAPLSFAAANLPTYPAREDWSSASTAAPVPQAAPPPSDVPQLAPLKLKEQPKRPRGTRAPAVAPAAPVSILTPASTEPSGSFPWKIAAGIVVVAIAGTIGARFYSPSAVKTEEVAATQPSAPAPPVKLTLPPVAPDRGRLEIETQPAGARVLLDGKPAGESPLTIDGVPAGRHTLTFISSSGSVKRTIRVEAGRVAKVDVPIFSGWVGLYVPFIVEVSEGGRVIGNTEEPRLMLSPGRHVLTLTNRELGYSSVQTVDIEPGEVRSISLDPRGSVNLNASPWAEVWIDGKKIGDTPIANHQMSLGVREVVFRHPQHGERRVTVTVKADGPAAVSIDMTR
jgi:hypothetical protein